MIPDTHRMITGVTADALASAEFLPGVQSQKDFAGAAASLADDKLSPSGGVSSLSTSSVREDKQQDHLGLAASTPAGPQHQTSADERQAGSLKDLLPRRSIPNGYCQRDAHCGSPRRVRASGSQLCGAPNFHAHREHA